ncbi:hypothetical protein AVEN_82267-1 [Araneus ventricosus]|uniref:Uncharacterized protein n=1 Tax=Araneus ventricosus TaxID=182803 RepID=A0A4Y2HDN6_ARAVE|nr:hypothetical protein AVEN_82267-1 [Araneus ventricosus]
MASDLKIEIFAYDIFSKLFINFGKTKPSIFQIYGDECCKSNSYVEACDTMYYEAMLCRFLSFKTIYLKELAAKKIKSLKSLSDCYDYVIQICDRNDLFGHLTVLERMFATSAFVLTLCEYIYFETTSVIDVLNFGHLFWATYFDKFTETFYKAGGWKELGRVAESYFMFASSLDLAAQSENYLNVMKEASVNYHKFKKTAELYEYKHVTKHWIKFHINNFENYITISLNYQHSIDAYEGELLLEDFKRLCDPHAENSIEVFEKCPTFDSSEEIKAFGDDNLQIEHLSEQNVRIIDTYCGELSENSAGLENQIQSECSLSNMKVIPYNLIDSNTNLKCHEKTFLKQI